MVKRISERLIREGTHDKNVMKALALSLAVKSLYKSSQINNCTYSRIAELFHISRTSAKARIDTLRRMKMVVDIGDHLLFLPLRDSDIKIKNIDIQDYSSINLHNLKEVEKFLRLQGVFIKQSQIDYAVNVKKDILNPPDAQTYRAAKRKSKKIAHWDGLPDSGQSINTVMKSSGLGRNGAINILKWGESNGLLIKKKRISKVSIAVGIEDSFKLPSDRGRYFSYGGFLFHALPSILIFMMS